MPTDHEQLAFLGIDPASLDPAPDRPTRADWWPRIDAHADRGQCCSCRALAVATRVVDIPGLGRRWHDQCRDCMIAGTRLTWDGGRPMEGRYRVTVTLDGKPMLQGWWDHRPTADGKYVRWIGDYGGRAGASVNLVNEQTGETLTSWPGGP